MNAIIDQIQKILPLISFLAFPILIVIVSFYVVRRSGNISLVMNKIWSFFIGEKKYYDETLDKIEQEEHDVARFNFKHNFKLKNKKHIETLINSTRKYDIELNKLSGMHRYYNADICKLKKVPSGDFYKSLMSSLLYLVILVPLLVLSFYFIPRRAFSSFEFFVLNSYLVIIILTTIAQCIVFIHIVKTKMIRKHIYNQKIKFKNK